LHALSLTTLGGFLERRATYSRATYAHRRDGLPEAITSLERSIEQLSRRGQRRPGPLARLTGAY